jgi:Tfp pilus assembly protein PilF
MGDYRDAKGNLFNMFNRVIKQIAGEVKISMTTAQEAMLAESRTIDPKAIDAYLKGYSYVDDMSPEPLIKARDYLNNAIEKDPEWAPVYAAMAAVWFTMGSMGSESPEIAIPKVYEYLNKALELEPDLMDAHYISAVLAYSVEMNWEKAEKEFLKALAINPNHALCRMHYSFMLFIMQRPEEAKIQADLAYGLDPLNTIVQSTYGFALLCGGDCASALSVLENVVASDPDNFLAYNYIHPAAFQCGDLDKVFEADKHMLPLEEEAINEIEKIFNEKGFYKAYEELTRQLEILAEKIYIPHTDMAFRYYMINQDDKAIEWIEKAAELGEPSIAWIGIKAWNFTRLYDNPRFIEVLKKMNLPLPKSD